ncbi:hypothetical protein ACLBXJ_27110 [Methylobacterium mesophilicum]|uniref:hypothetical protein n=1 Tax=Methylobacterium TaxID=407 RepID=UPI0011CC4596|nr:MULTISPECIES: hypothetical protein [Methylobacterium]TXN44890.1 hypothetical protein FV233_13145 [Methylobacterium sp. WL7]TXN66223.1 hypothetical protein FV228_15045 [Methylobacterium sp. WL18]GJE24485.1 hypothetical protein JHFBIEKO_4958 [Methylobacterium mesophilicum]
MTDLLEKAVAAVRQMSADDQDAIAQAMLSMAKIADSLEIEPEHVAAVMASLEQADRGAFVEGEASTIIARAFACVASAQPSISAFVTHPASNRDRGRCGERHER